MRLAIFELGSGVKIAVWPTQVFVGCPGDGKLAQLFDASQPGGPPAWGLPVGFEEACSELEAALRDE